MGLPGKSPSKHTSRVTPKVLRATTTRTASLKRKRKSDCAYFEWWSSFLLGQIRREVFPDHIAYLTSVASQFFQTFRQFLRPQTNDPPGGRFGKYDSAFRKWDVHFSMLPFLSGTCFL